MLWIQIYALLLGYRLPQSFLLNITDQVSYFHVLECVSTYSFCQQKKFHRINYINIKSLNKGLHSRFILYGRGDSSYSPSLLLFK